MLILSIFTAKSYAEPSLKKLKLQAKSPYPDKYKNYFELAAWIRENAPDSFVTVCRKGQLFYLFSRKYTSGYKNTLNQEEQINYLKKVGADYVVLEQLGYSSTGRYLYPAIKRYPAKFKIIKHIKNPDTYLMKFLPDLG